MYLPTLLVAAILGGACGLVAGWVAASMRYMELSGRVSEMEAAVVRYWDRVRKRMTIENEYGRRPREAPAPADESPILSPEEIMKRAHAGGHVLDVPVRS